MKTLFFSLVFSVFIALPTIALGCSCARQEPGEAFNRATAVFIGKVGTGSEQQEISSTSGHNFILEYGKVEFQVQEVFKGDIGSTLTADITGGCSFQGIPRGESYIVYAFKGQRPGDDVYYAGSCTRTARLTAAYAQEDLDFLRALPPAGSGGIIKGGITLLGSRSLPHVFAGLNVTLTAADGRVLTVLTDQAGNFKASKLVPGKYTVTLQVPESYKISYSRKEITLNDRGTEVANFEVKVDGHVKGRVVDKKGLPYNAAFLYLENAENWAISHLRKDGSFDLDGVAPGEYRLYISTRYPDGKEGKYWYPGTYKSDEAEPIRVGLGETVSGLRLVLPENLAIVQIEGRVFWPDGRPAKGVEVMLRCPRDIDGERGYGFDASRIITGENGTFILPGFAGHAYRLSASFANGIPAEDRHSPELEITPFKDIRGVKLVVSKIGRGDLNCETLSPPLIERSR